MVFYPEEIAIWTSTNLTGVNCSINIVIGVVHSLLIHGSIVNPLKDCKPAKLKKTLDFARICFRFLFIKNYINKIHRQMNKISIKIFLFSSHQMTYKNCVHLMSGYRNL